MYEKSDSKPNKFWNDLSTEDRVEFLSQNEFWDGFRHYLYDYLPSDLRDLIAVKTA